MQRPTCLATAQDKICKFNLLIKPATYQPERPASSFGLSLPTAYGGWFQIAPGQLPSSLQTIMGMFSKALLCRALSLEVENIAPNKVKPQCSILQSREMGPLVGDNMQ